MQTKVLVIDDSITIRTLLTSILDKHPNIKVVGTAVDPYDAREKIKQLNPDVLTLDIEMPKMNGLEFLSNLMRLRPTPVVMVSTLTQHGADITLQALELGAIDYVAKPQNIDALSTDLYGNMLTEKVLTAAKANLNATSPTRSRPATLVAPKTRVNKRIIAIGASTGGTEAIKELLVGLPSDIPPIVIAQHIRPLFSTSFANRLDGCTNFTVQEVDEVPRPLLGSHVYLAPGGQHIKVLEKRGQLFGVASSDAEVNRHRPSVEVLFDSVNQWVGNESVAVMLTGMGRDGAEGMKRLKDRGGLTLSQNQESCVIWGMPRAAVELGAVCSEHALKDLPKAILNGLVMRKLKPSKEAV
ncbi:protein-glutamate methylesterase/protein-glutamine glutaminase [Ferrimonas aestuarii]|uniref:Protein-glutamate methylesterase/protein-glutamine glutaminase n=1 Tax=Ferrimonas aestuarii TaxID=2569539 RepID=A0A4U1BS79_9GAMM|nr:chemotaxis response regulator protein-glutamate methylesterase [Ferrimonas aestuarii]TKB57456.1 chemotaxis response regulator protein-glutamate methylesterase [Ferrimonas aestuarii]